VIVTASRERRDGSGAVETAPLSAAAPGPLFFSLSPREVEILQLLADGYTTLQIAQHFEVSPKTLQAHRQNILRKTGTHSMVRAVVLALKQGVIR
jgi:two-component system response regulator DegU